MESYNVGDEVYFQSYPDREPVHSVVHRKGTLAELRGLNINPVDDRIFYELKCIKDKSVFTLTTASSIFREKPESFADYKLLDKPVVLYSDPAETQLITHVKFDKVVVSYVEYGTEYKTEKILLSKLPQEILNEILTFI